MLVTFANGQKAVASIIIYINAPIYVAVARSVKEKHKGSSLSFIFPLFIVQWHSGLKAACSNLAVSKQGHLQKHTLL
jgi:hypothetical protein